MDVQAHVSGPLHNTMPSILLELLSNLVILYCTSADTEISLVNVANGNQSSLPGFPPARPSYGGAF